MDVMRLIGFRSFSVGAILLCGLLAYDVFWVFGSPSVVGSNEAIASSPFWYMWSSFTACTVEVCRNSGASNSR